MSPERCKTAENERPEKIREKKSLPDGSGARKKRDPDFYRPVMAILVARVRGEAEGAGPICIAGVDRI